jgi:hypothetical protein
MKTILKEELGKIKSMMGLLNEQISGQLISDKGYQAILSFENKKGTPKKDEDGNYNGATSMNYDLSSVKSLEGVISSHIKATIGLKNWFKIPDLFRTQIYSYMFNSDSGTVDGYKWIAGLAQSIDSNIDRDKIVRKPFTDPNVQSAIKLINQTINNGTINNYYSQYLQVLDSQYLSTSKNNYVTDSKGNKTLSPFHVASYKYSWAFRPQEIEQYYNGTHPDMKPEKKVVTTKPVEKPASVNKPVQVNKSTQTPASGQKKLVIRTADLTSFMEAIKTGTAGKTFDLKKSTADVDGFIANLVEDPNGTKIIKMVLAVSLSGQNCESCKSILAKNNAQVVDKGTFEDGKRIYNLIAIIS